MTNYSKGDKSHSSNSNFEKNVKKIAIRGFLVVEKYDLMAL